MVRLTILTDGSASRSIAALGSSGTKMKSMIEPTTLKLEPEDPCESTLYM